MTSSSEVQALTTRDGNDIVELREAIEAAMAGQHERTAHVHHDVSLRAADAEPEMKQARPATIRQRLIR